MLNKKRTCSYYNRTVFLKKSHVNCWIFPTSGDSGKLYGSAQTHGEEEDSLFHYCACFASPTLLLIISSDKEEDESSMSSTEGSIIDVVTDDHVYNDHTTSKVLIMANVKEIPKVIAFHDEKVMMDSPMIMPTNETIPLEAELLL